MIVHSRRIRLLLTVALCARDVDRPPTHAAPTCPGNSRSSRSSNFDQGPVAKIISVIIIIVTGLTLAFGETSGGFRRLIQIVFGLSIAFAASSFFLAFFQFGGGVLV